MLFYFRVAIQVLSWSALSSLIRKQSSLCSLGLFHDANPSILSGNSQRFRSNHIIHLKQNTAIGTPVIVVLTFLSVKRKGGGATTGGRLSSYWCPQCFSAVPTFLLF